MFPTPSPPHGNSSRASPSVTGERKAPKEQPRIRRRNRLITSCLECRRRKLKCDKLQPCTNCTKFSRDCLYIAPALDPAGQAKIANLKEKMGMLEKTLEEDIARRTRSEQSITGMGVLSKSQLPGMADDLSDQEDEEDVKDLVPTSLAIEDAAYYEDEDVNEDLIDLGISLGKLRITERVGGFVRPRFNEELGQAIKKLPKTEDSNLNPFLKQSPSTWMAPGHEYIPPSSSFCFSSGLHKTTLLTHLPSKVMVDKLMDHYWRAVHIVARTVHRPSFERQYERFWNDISVGIEPRSSFQAVVFAALLSSTISMTENKILEEFGVARDSLVDNFREGTEAALSRANFLHTTRLETLQAFVMYLISLCRAEVTRAHSALTGTCIRLAECMSLHRDPSHYTSNAIEQHVRRLVWYQICFLDLRTCEATGPRPQIRREDFDTRFPNNIDDADLEKGIQVNEDRNYFTDMTIMRMRIECYEMHRVLWTERPKLDSKRTTLTTLLSKIQRFCQAMEKTYLPFLHKNQPLHVLAMEIYGILSCRMYVMVLQKFTSTHYRIMPERLRSMSMSCAIMTLEHSMVIETTPALSTWSWYVGALHQNHAALLLLSEFYITNERDPSVEARIWRCLDHVFSLSPSITGEAKCRMVLEELRGRIETYHATRRVRAPARMEHAGPPEDPGASEQRDRRSSSVQSGVSSSFTVSSGNSSHHLQPGYQHQSQMANLDSMASLNYSLGAGNSPALHPQASAEVHNYTFAGPAHDGTISQSAGTGTSPSQGQHSHEQSESSITTGSSSEPNNAAGMLGGTGGSPLDMLPEIDWVSSYFPFQQEYD
ncbi:hypothetical protein BU24DRAFT_288514 [Aaosphaeria arxii CBS 175.79]|uniref:Zn(2)-C6 fungal-type domain-containing protein n=1 Tax=Aaosphaeria arxii CBS 175.79 TaxID=1450172 RepID=A0A6A5XFN5_9PLEO|nr:uncharacterized protein BU24DRAFT_288514 [Aaosphaeria arxii CBS 175.79]KAF2011750.1 hypothetical protein BU24DRAFT_288514 [Aaosphaeria arxii CBS 175.79]